MISILRAGILHVAIAFAAYNGMAYSYFLLVGQACAIGTISSFAFTRSPVRWIALAVACPYFSLIVYSKGIYNSENLAFFLVILMFMTTGLVSLAGLGIAFWSGRWKGWKWDLRTMILEIGGFNLALATFIGHIPGYAFTEVTVYDEAPELLAMALFSWTAISAFLLTFHCTRQAWRIALLLSVPMSAVVYHFIMVIWLAELSYGVTRCLFLYACVFFVVLSSLHLLSMEPRSNNSYLENVTPN